MKLGADFQTYVHLVCQYAYLEYDFGLKSKFALFYLNEEILEYLGASWVSSVSVPNSANYLAKKIKSDMDL